MHFSLFQDLLNLCRMCLVGDFKPYFEPSLRRNDKNNIPTLTSLSATTINEPHRPPSDNSLHLLTTAAPSRDAPATLRFPILLTDGAGLNSWLIGETVLNHLSVPEFCAVAAAVKIKENGHPTLKSPPAHCYFHPKNSTSASESRTRDTGDWVRFVSSVGFSWRCCRTLIGGDAVRWFFWSSVGENCAGFGEFDS